MAKPYYVVELEQRRFYTGNDDEYNKPDTEVVHTFHVEHASVEDRHGRAFERHANCYWLGVTFRTNVVRHMSGDGATLAALAVEMNNWMIEHNFHPFVRVLLHLDNHNGPTLDVIFPHRRNEDPKTMREFVTFWDGRSFKFNGRTNLNYDIMQNDTTQDKQQEAA